MVFVAIGLLVMLGMFALVVDMGMLYKERSQLVNAVDAGALAGVTALTKNEASARELAATRARTYVQRNVPEVLTGDIIVTFEDSVSGTATITNGRINVTATKNVPLNFAKFLGFNSAPVAATASAGLQYYGGGTGIVPFGITQDVYSGMTEDVRYIVKYGPQPPDDAELTALGYPPASTFKGNFGALALGGSGASVYGDNIKYGSSIAVKVGDTISTEPGVMSGPTDKAVDYRVGLDPTATWDTVADGSPRIIIVPIIDPGVGDISGRTDVTIMGFAAFFLEDFQPAKGNGGYVVGRFIGEAVVSGGTGGSSVNTGIFVASLVK